MFTAADVLARTRRQPFQPFRIVTTTGQTYDIMHADMALTLPNRIMVSVPTVSGTPDRYTEVALFHITELRDLLLTAAPPSNGPAG